MTEPVLPGVQRRQVLGLVAAGLLPAACSRRGGTPTAPGASAPASAPGTPGVSPPPTFAWAGQGLVPATPGKTLLGAYFGLAGQSLPQALALRRSQLGRDPRIVHYFYGWKDTLPASYPGLPDGTVPMVSWRGTAYNAILNGSSDAHIKANARSLARYGRPVLLRFGWEMNGDWYAWGGPRNDRNIAGFIEVWRRLHRIFRAEGAVNVSWVWAPNWNSKPAEAWNDLNHYYPGDDVVDWVGVSGYPLGGEAPETLFGSIYRQYTDRRPLMLAEVAGIDHGGRTKADWIIRLDRWIDAHPAVGAMVWFDTDSHPWSTENFRIDSTPETLAAYQALVADPRFAV